MDHAYDRSAAIQERFKCVQLGQVMQVNQVGTQARQGTANELSASLCGQDNNIGEAVSPFGFVSAGGLFVNKREAVASIFKFACAQADIDFRASEVSQMAVDE
jgi:hypothetical protein